MRFTDRVAVVTGAASGIGLATACRLASEGARVAALVHNPASAAATEAAVRDAGRDAGALDVLVLAVDVADEAAVVAAVAQVAARWGRVDAAVNSAGVMTFKPFDAWTAADWTHVLGVDLVGAYVVLRECVRHMPDGPERRGGAVVNVSSVHAARTTPLVAPYAAAKAGLDALTRAAAIEGRPRGIRVNSVLPGAIDTPMLWDNPNVASGVETVDPDEVGSPESVAAAIAFLLSDDAAFITGASLAVDGGRLAAL